VLEACLPVLLREGSAFKVASTTAQLSFLENAAARSQAGKFLTVYPEDDAQAVRLAQALEEATQGLPGPRILSDRPLRPGSLVHYRYGSFDNNVVLYDDLGQVVPALRAPDGSLVPDRRSPWFDPPPWAQDPFEAAGLVERPPLHGQGPLGTRYQAFQALNQRSKGGIYLVKDEESGHIRVLKEARAHTQVDAYGRDARDRLRHEYALLKEWEGTPWPPKAYDLFEQEDNLYLVEEHLPFPTLRKYISDRFLEGRPLSSEELERIVEALLALLKGVHSQGLLLRDLTPQNVLLGPEGELKLIDWELAYPWKGEKKEPPFPGHTPGYASPQQVRGEPPAPTDDLYSFGGLLFFLITGRDPLFLGEPDTCPRRALRVVELIAPTLSSRWKEALEGCLQPDPRHRPPSVDLLEEFLKGGPYA